MGIITLEECQLIFDDEEKIKKFLSDRYSFSLDEIKIILLGSLDSFKNMMLIDIIYDSYVKLGCIENKSDVEIKLYNKLLNILNYHIKEINFKDKNSRFIKEFEYAMLHYDEPDLGSNNKK